MAVPSDHGGSLPATVCSAAVRWGTKKGSQDRSGVHCQETPPRYAAARASCPVSSWISTAIFVSADVYCLL